MSEFLFFDFLVIGHIRTEFIVDLQDHSFQDMLGGSALYAAGGMRCWSDRIAVISHAHKEKKECLEKIQRRYRIDLQGIKYHEISKEEREFHGYLTPSEEITENPVAFYSSKGILFPKDLIGFTKNESDEYCNSAEKYYPEDIPIVYKDITTTLVCRASQNTQFQLTSLLHQASTKVLVLQASSQYMSPAFFDSMQIFLKDVTTFITTPCQLRQLFKNRSENVWEMAEQLCDFGCEHVVINGGISGQLLFDRQTRQKWQISAYPTSWVDPTGTAEAFCGGFTAGLKKNYDPIEGLLCGVVSTSLKAEGSGPFYPAECMPELLSSRLKFAREFLKCG